MAAAGLQSQVTQLARYRSYEGSRSTGAGAEEGDKGGVDWMSCEMMRYMRVEGRAGWCVVRWVRSGVQIASVKGEGRNCDFWVARFLCEQVRFDRKKEKLDVRGKMKGQGKDG